MGGKELRAGCEERLTGCLTSRELTMRLKISLLRRGGLHRRRLLVVATRGGDGDVEGPSCVLGRFTGDKERRRPGGGIS